MLEPTEHELRVMKQQLKKQLLKDATQLEKFINSNRRRIAGLLLAQDTGRDHRLTAESLMATLKKLKVPVEEEHMLRMILVALARETGKNGQVNYQLLMRGNLGALIEKHITENELVECGRGGQEIQKVVFGEESATKLVEQSSAAREGDVSHSSTSAGTKPAAERLKRSTMTGKNGEWASEYKQEAVRQFNELIEYCKEHEIILDRATAEKGIKIISFCYSQKHRLVFIM